MLNGNIVGKVNAASGTSASGLWTLREQSIAKLGSTWPGMNSPITYVSAGSTSGSTTQTWNFTPGISTCVVVGITALAYGGGSPVLSNATFSGTNLTIIKDKYLTNYEPSSTTPAVYSWLLGIIGNFNSGSNYPIYINVTNVPGGGSITATAMSFSGPVTGFAGGASNGGAVVPSDTTTATVTISSAGRTSLIGYGARQSNSPSLSGGTLRATANPGVNTQSQMAQIDDATSQTFSTVGGAVSGCYLTW